MVSYKEIAINVLRNNKHPLSANEIYSFAKEKNLIDNEKFGLTPRETIKAVICMDIKKYGDNSFFRRTNPGKFVYNELNKRNFKDVKDDNKAVLNEETKSDSLFTGKGGEYQVCSELFYRGFYACPMPLDDGIDILAIKNDKQYYIQVKTSNRNKNGKFNFTINKDSFERYEKENMYYILVPNILNQKVAFILDCNEIRNIINKGKGKMCNICLTEKKGNFFYKKDIRKMNSREKLN